jgi:hypothetical protein
LPMRWRRWWDRWSASRLREGQVRGLAAHPTIGRCAAKPHTLRIGRCAASRTPFGRGGARPSRTLFGIGRVCSFSCAPPPPTSPCPSPRPAGSSRSAGTP